MKRKNIFVIGGDLRVAQMAKGLSNEGNFVLTYAAGPHNVSPGIGISKSLEEGISNSEYIILGLPCSKDDETVYAPFHQEDIQFREIFELCDKNKLVIAGMVSKPIAITAESYGVELIDYFQRDDIAIYNAIPTAEGAIEIAMHNTPYTLCGSKCLVVGYGRVGTILASKLGALGANVSVAARKPKDLAEIKVNRFTPVKIKDLHNHLESADIIFNTVPVKIFTNCLLEFVREDSLIIDIASKPGGVDMQAATQMSKMVIWALSLPGKVAPITAGDIIKDTILNIFDEMGV